MSIKYRIMFDYGSDGLQLQDGEFETIDEAVKHAVAMNYSAKFIIVSIHWTPELINKSPKKS